MHTPGSPLEKKLWRHAVDHGANRELLNGVRQCLDLARSQSNLTKAREHSCGLRVRSGVEDQTPLLSARNGEQNVSAAIEDDSADAQPGSECDGGRLVRARSPGSSERHETVDGAAARAGAAVADLGDSISKDDGDG